MSVEVHCKALRSKQVRVHDLSGVGYVDDPECQAAANKLEKLAADMRRISDYVRPKIPEGQDPAQADNVFGIIGYIATIGDALAEAKDENERLKRQVKNTQLEFDTLQQLREGRLSEAKAENERLRIKKQHWTRRAEAAEKERDEWKAAYQEACDNYADLLAERQAGARVKVAIDNISDETLRYIAESKDITTCRERVRAAIVIRLAALSAEPATDNGGGGK